MRRLKILFYWVFTSKNNINFGELLKFLSKPKIDKLALRYIESIEEGEDYIVRFKKSDKTLYWPKVFGIKPIYQVVTETFDADDWHYYRKEKTEIEPDDILLDIGTAEGLFPLVVVDECHKIYLVEPSKLFVNCLKKTFKPYENKVVILNNAVGHHDGQIDFSENSLSSKVEDSNSGKTYKVNVNKIDTLIPVNEKITYLKADIEGFEYEMLKGAVNTIKRNKPKIAIATYHIENNTRDIIDLVLSYVPEYNHYVKGIFDIGPKPVMIHFWID